MILRDVPSYLIGHGADVVAVYPVLHGIVLVIVFIANGQDNLPKGFQVRRLALCRHFLSLAPGTGIGIVGAAKLSNVLNADRDEDSFLRIAAQVEVLLVIVSPRGITHIDIGSPAEGILTVAVVHRFAVTAVEVYLKPAFRVGYCPEVSRSDMNLWYGLGIGALDKVSYAEPLVTKHWAQLSAACLEEEVLPADIGIALLQVNLVVGMYGADDIDGSRQSEVVA